VKLTIFHNTRLDLATGEITELFTAMGNQTRFAAISPDGAFIAFTDRITNTAFGLFVSPLTGLDRQLIAQMDLSDNFWASNAVWPPDGKWLILNLLITGISKDEIIPVLVNIHTCQIDPLPFNGQHILAWLP
jgi:hypothetical protein